MVCVCIRFVVWIWLGFWFGCWMAVGVNVLVLFSAAIVLGVCGLSVLR